jgi:ABC-type polysaccharide/polyol phosphate export permease
VNPNLIGFYVGFFAMLVLPITSFFVARGKKLKKMKKIKIFMCFFKNFIANFQKFSKFLIILIFLDLFQNKFQMNPNKVNLYSAIVSVVTIYLLLIIYIFYYYYEDFKQVFCKKKKNIQVNIKDNTLIKEKSG